MSEDSIMKVMTLLDKNTEHIKNLSILDMMKKDYDPYFIELAIILGARLDEKDERGNDIIDRASSMVNPIPVLEILKKYDVNFNTESAVVAVLLAIKNNDKDMIKFFIENGLSLSWYDEIILKTAQAKAIKTHNDEILNIVMGK